MRPIWKGAISFGLVFVPVRVYSATESKDLHFRMLHSKCGYPLRYVRWCNRCEEEVPIEDVVKGYEHAPGSFIRIEEDELKSLPLPTSHVIEIKDFVDLNAVEPIYFEKAYFLEPADGGEKAYALLYQSIARQGKIAIGKVALRSKESLAALRPYGSNTLLLETMFYPDEIRSAPEHAASEAAINEKELEVASTLINLMSRDFNPAIYKDEYRNALQSLIDQKIQGRQVEKLPEVTPAKVVDLMETLKESVRIAEAQRKAEAVGSHA